MKPSSAAYNAAPPQHSKSPIPPMLAPRMIFPLCIQLVYLVPNTKHYMTGPKSRFVIPPPECHPFIIKLFEVYGALVVILKFQDFSFIFLLPNVKTTLNYIVDLLKE